MKERRFKLIDSFFSSGLVCTILINRYLHANMQNLQDAWYQTWFLFRVCL